MSPAVRSVSSSWCMASRTAMLVAVGGPVRSSSVGAAFRLPMMMVGARRERRRYARLRVSTKSLVFSPNGRCVSSTFSCHPGPTHSYSPRRPSSPRSGWACTVTDVLWWRGTPCCQWA